MARIRSLHPGFWTDEVTMTLSVECPLGIPVLQGLWNEADDQGVFEWKPLVIKAKVLPAAMVNLLGEEGHTGKANYEGLEQVLAMPGTHVHLYGKKTTKPFRKMGHVTIVDPDVESLKKKVNFVKETLKVTT